MEVSKVVWNQNFDRTFHTPGGMLGRDMKRRANRVLVAAKGQVGVETGNLRRLLKSDVNYNSRLGLHARVGTWVQPGIGVAFWHHQGTKPHVIAASPGNHLRFMGHNRAITIRTEVMHPGTAPNKYLADNLYLAVM